MSKTLVINSSNYIIGSNNKFVYRFPNTQTFEAGSSIGLSSISIYNSTFNIEKNRGNNVIQIIWLGTTYTIIIDDGYYNVSDLNFKIQQFCILNNLYLLSNSGSNIIYYYCVSRSKPYYLDDVISSVFFNIKCRIVNRNRR